MQRDFHKWRQENEIINIMRNCLYEVKRDVMLKETKRSKRSNYTGSTHLITQQQTNPDKNNPRIEELTLEDKYELVKSLMGHSFILDKLKEIIDEEIGMSEKFSFYQGQKIKRNISGLKSLKIKSPNQSGIISGKPSGRKSYIVPKRLSKSRSKLNFN